MRSGLRRAFRAQRDTTPVPLASRASRSNIFNLGGGKQDRETMERQYGRSGTLYSIVSLLAQSAATPQWHLYEKVKADGRRRYATSDAGDDMRREITVHAACKLLQNPNPFQTRFEFFEASNQHLELCGECFWVVNMEAGFPTSLWLARPDRMEAVPDPDKFLAGWIYTAPDGTQIPLKVSEVIQEKLPDPLDPYRGAGPIASIMPNVEQQRYATEYTRNMFINGAQPGGVISTPHELTQREFDELTDRWREGHQGVARAGRTAVLENGATWTAAAPTNRDMEYVNLRLQNRDEIREAYRMHKSMLGTVEDVNRANAQTAEEVFNSWSVLPRLNRRRETINSKLLPLFGTSGEGVEFDYDDPSPVNQEAANAELLSKAQAVLALKQAGYDPSDILEVVGLPDMGLAEVAPQPTQPAEANSMIGDREKVTIYGKSDPATKVYKQQLDDYPPGALGWMLHATWMGPVDVPMEHINSTMDWMDTPDPERVQHFVKRMQDGKKVNPVVLVKTPGKKKLLLVDGHHRYLAAAELGLPVKAFIGTVDSDNGEWTEMHDRQYAREYGNGGGSNTLGEVFMEGLRPYTARTLNPVALNRRKP